LLLSFITLVPPSGEAGITPIIGSVIGVDKTQSLGEPGFEVGIVPQFVLLAFELVTVHPFNEFPITCPTGLASKSSLTQGAALTELVPLGGLKLLFGIKLKF
jgi:hypothetical protein